MKSFLEQQLDRIMAEQSNHLERVTIVFNNKRPARFLKQYIANRCGSAYFLPNIIGFDDLVAELGNLEIVPNEFLIFELYEIYRATTKDSNVKPLEDFIATGDKMLADFSEVDSYMIKAESLYGYLHALKSIGEWDIEGKPLNARQTNYLEFYKSIYTYYDELRNYLKPQGKAYYGMAYREVAENIEQRLEDNKLGTVYFLGFNALSVCERKIIEAFLKRGNAYYIPDGDAHYFNGKHEAGYFLRKHKDLMAEGQKFEEHFAKGHNRPIHIVNAQDNVTQAKYVGQLLDKLARGEFEAGCSAPLSKTALVLADENLIVPVLNSLPASLTNPNVTMGLRFVSTDMHSLALSLLSLYARCRGDRNLYYHRDISDLMDNVYLAKLLGINELGAKVKACLTKENMVYASKGEIVSLMTSIGVEAGKVDFLFDLNPAVSLEVLGKIKETASKLAEADVIDDGSKEIAALEVLMQIVEYMLSFGNYFEQIGNVPALQKIYQRVAQRYSVSFVGDTEGAMQITGVLETRNLDFERVILLSANEGVIPSDSMGKTMIPNSLKKEYGLPTAREKDAVYAYNFYRLIQRAEEVYLVYTSETGATNSGAESRFVLQVRAELPKKYPESLKVIEKSVSVSNTVPETNIVTSVPKTDEVMELLRSMYFSPSSLNNFRDCPLKFYYYNVVGAREEDSLNDELDNKQLGTVVHNAMEELYAPFVGKELTVDNLDAMLAKVESVVDSLLNKVLVNTDSSEGMNYYLRTVILAQIKSFLETEKTELKETMCKVKIVELEKKNKEPMSIKIAGKETNVNFDNRADRIDEKDGVLRVIDYKTGRVKTDDLTVKELNVDDWAKWPEKWFQVMFYAWYFWRSKGKNKPINLFTGLAPMQYLGSGLKEASIGNTSVMTAVELEDFEKALGNILGEILNQDLPFISIPDKNKCKYCTALNLCGVS